jgi:hypothetical protein
MTQRAGCPDAEGLAALGICESLLLALKDLKIISGQEVRDLLTDVATTHSEAAMVSEPERHRAVIAIIQRILDGDTLPR